MEMQHAVLGGRLANGLGGLIYGGDVGHARIALGYCEYVEQARIVPEMNLGGNNN